MNVDNFRDSIDLLDELTSKKDKKDDIYMYCTGGIRCLVAGTYLRKKGYENVKMVILLHLFIFKNLTNPTIIKLA
jgi:UPF0176 protein